MNPIVIGIFAPLTLVLVIWLMCRTPKPIKPKELSKWERVMAKYPIGHTFTYRTGHKLTVVAALDELDCGENWEPGGLTCEYVDNQGRICHVEFGPQQADYLLSL